MSKKTFLINNFSGGLNQTTDKRKIQDNELSLALNARVNENNTIGVGGELGLYLYNLPHSNTNFQFGYGLFATSVDVSPTVIRGEFESGFEEGTVQSYSGTTLTLAATPSFQSTTNHATNDFYNNMTVVIVEGNGIGESRRITDYNGSSKQATITDAFSGSVNSSSKYKIYNWAGDNTKFGNQDELDYIDKGGTDFPYDDIDSPDIGYDNSYFLRTKSTTLTDGTSADLGFVTHNPSKSYNWGAGDALGPENTSIGNNTLKSGITYTMSFYCRAKYKYYGYGTDGNNSSQRRERVPFVQIYSDSVTDGTNTGLYLFQSRNGTSFQSGAETTYDYADNLTTEYVKNGDYEGGTIHGGNGGHGGATDYDPPTDWMAYDGFAHNTNNTITYTFISGANSFGSDSTGTSGRTLNLNGGSSYSFINFSSAGITPNCYLYQDLTLEDNQWYDLSFVYSTTSSTAIAFSIVDTFDLTSTGIVSNESTLAATDGDAVLTVDGTAATDALVKNREIYKLNVDGSTTFLGVCTAVNSTTEIRFAAGTAAAIDNDTTLYVANYITPWSSGIGNSGTNGITTYNYGGETNSATKKIPYKFFVPNNSGTPRVIRIAFAPMEKQVDYRLDSVSVKKSLPDLSSMSISNDLTEDLPGNPYSEDILSWNRYEFQFTIPPEYDNASDWVINLNAGSYYYQAGATGSENHQIVYFDNIKIESDEIGGDLIFLNDNTTTESKINIYSANEDKWVENTGLTWPNPNMKPIYNYINGVLKISDANFESGNTSKIFYYNKNKYECRSNPISSPPMLLVSASGNTGEVDKTFDALEYINTYTYEQNHQYYLVGDTKTTTNWPLDDLDGLGRVIRYYHAGSSEITNPTSYPLQDESGAELTRVQSTWNINPPLDDPSTSNIDESRITQSDAEDTVTNPMYFTWCGTHGNTGDVGISNDDMNSKISGLTTGSVSRITFEFTYEFQGHRGTDSDRRIPDTVYPPKFIITAGKRTTNATDVFGSGTEVTDNNQRDLSLGDTDFVEMENVKQATIFVDKIGGKVYDIQSEVDANKTWQNSDLYEWTDEMNAGNRRKSFKTFYGQISFDDGDIELADDIILKFYIDYPENENGFTMIDSLTGFSNVTNGSNFYPRWEKVKFSHIKTHFRTTNWTALSNGFTINDINRTKTNFNFDTPSGATAFGWGERIFQVGVSSVNIFDEESNIESSQILIGTTESGTSETSVSSISAGQCPDVDIYIGEDAFNDEYRKELKYYMKDTNSDIYYLQFYVNLKTNTIYSTTSNFKSTGNYDSTNKYYHYFIPKEKILNYNEVDSYESQTLVSQDLTKNELLCDYKTAVVANNRLYVGNIRQDGKLFPDRMLKSPIGKYNILPKDSFIDVAINDGDEIVALEYFESKLLQFKKRKLFIINTSGDFEFLEKTYDNIGVSHPMQVAKTPYGIVWANSKGCYLYDGNQLIDLLQNKLTNDVTMSETIYYWNVKDDIENNIDYAVSVGYNAKTEEIVIKRGHNNGVAAGLSFTFTSDGFVYSFKTKTWYLTYKSFQFNSANTYPPQLSNFVTTADGDCIAYGKKNIESQSWGAINKWYHSEATDKSTGFLTQHGITNTSYKLFQFQTKEYDLGNPNVKKRLYKVIINYENSDANVNDVTVNATFGCDEYKTTSDILGTQSFIERLENFNNTRNINYSSSTGFAESNSQEKKEQAILYPTVKEAKNFYTVYFTFLSYNLTHNPTFKIHSIELIYRDKSIR